MGLFAAEDEGALAALVGEHVVHDRIQVRRVDLAVRRHDPGDDARDAPDARVVRSPGQRVGKSSLELDRERSAAGQRLVDALEHGHGERAPERLDQTRRGEWTPRDDSNPHHVVPGRAQPIDVCQQRVAERARADERHRRIARGDPLDDVVTAPGEGLELAHGAAEREGNPLGERAIARRRRPPRRPASWRGARAPRRAR